MKRLVHGSSGSLNIIEPLTLVGKWVKHEFELEGTRLEKWYSGPVFDYDPVRKQLYVEAAYN